MFSLFKEKVKKTVIHLVCGYGGKKNTKHGYGGECIQRNTGCTERNPEISNL